MWVTEFGRMPTFQKGANGRDHNPKGFTAWLAGAGVKRAVQLRRDRRVRLPGRGEDCDDLRLARHDFALAGIDHERLSFYHNGIDRRLTDVHGSVIGDILG